MAARSSSRNEEEDRENRMEDEHENRNSGEDAVMEAAQDSYETTPEAATGFGKGIEHPGIFNRKKVMMAMCISFALVIGGGMLFNINRTSRSRIPEPPAGAMAARPPTGFLQGQLDRSLAALRNGNAEGETALDETEEPYVRVPPVSQIPAITWSDSPAAHFVPPSQTPPVHQAPVPPVVQDRAVSPPQRPTHYASPLVPRIEGRFTTAASPAPLNVSAPGGLNPFTSNDLLHPAAGPSGFGATVASGQTTDGHFIAEDSLWMGTIIPAILITAINTDLPGNILARVTENIFDSRTGRNLLIPQGTILFARYNNSVSYAQRRVQIAWDTLIRPDGFQLSLGGMDGVDGRGMAGQEAVYRENWFEYLKAAGIIAMFSVANAGMTEEASRHASEAVTGSIAQANAEFAGQTGSAIVSRAMNIQPTLTVASGTAVNILLNRNIALPPLAMFPVVQRYRME